MPPQAETERLFTTDNPVLHMGKATELCGGLFAGMHPLLVDTWPVAGKALPQICG